MLRISSDILTELLMVEETKGRTNIVNYRNIFPVYKSHKDRPKTKKKYLYNTSAVLRQI